MTEALLVIVAIEICRAVKLPQAGYGFDLCFVDEVWPSNVHFDFLPSYKCDMFLAQCVKYTDFSWCCYHVVMQGKKLSQI